MLFHKSESQAASAQLRTVIVSIKTRIIGIQNTEFYNHNPVISISCTHTTVFDCPHTI